MARTSNLLLVLAVTACTAPSADDQQPARADTARAAPAGQTRAANAVAAVRLARLPDNPMGNAASTTGTLEAEDGCLYLRTSEGGRYLIASTIPAGRWDAGRGALVVAGTGGGTFMPGDRVALGGSEAQATSLAGQWVEAPGSACDTGRIWVANRISSAAR
jgi:hypothetical protein